jgi:integrase
MRLNSKTVKALSLAAGKAEQTFWDDDLPGFGVRLRASGGASWIFQYDHAGRTRKVTLGAVTALPAEMARKTATELYAKVRLGDDPAAAKNAARTKAKDTFAAALKTYLPMRESKQRPRGYVETARHLLNHARPLHALPLVDIERRHVADLLTKTTAATGEVTANRVRTSLSSFFAWTVAQGLRETNPVAGTARHAEKSRERVLTNDELTLIWRHLEDDDFGVILKLLILTAARANEIAALSWHEIVDGEIRLPGDRTKNGNPHIIPLSGAAMAILDRQAERRPGRQYVFGRTADAPFIGMVKPRHKLDERIAAATGAALPHWTPHDIRRTAATAMAEQLGVLPHIIEGILNHVSGHKAGVAGTYNRATYEADKRAALEAWSGHVKSLVADAGESA